MKIIFIGNENMKSDGVLKSGYRGCHFEVLYPIYMGEEFKKLGYEVVYWNYGSQDLRDIKADAIFVHNSNFFTLLMRKYGETKWKDKLFLLLHRGDSDEMNREVMARHSDIVGFTCKEAMQEWQKKIPRSNCFVSNLGFPTKRSTREYEITPYKTSTPVLLYLGSMLNKETLPLLREVARGIPGAELHIITSYITTEDFSIRLLKDPSAELKQLLAKEDNIIFHGPMTYGSFDEYIHFATLGLNISIQGGAVCKRVQVRGKVWDYLSAGLPVVSMPENPESYIIHATECGLIVGKIEDYIPAIKKALKMKFDRQAAMKWMAENESYEVIANKWDKKIKELA